MIYVCCISSPSFWSMLENPRVTFLQMYFCFTNLCKKRKKREKEEQETLLELIPDFLFHKDDVPPLLTRDDTSFTWRWMGFLVNPMTLQKGKTELQEDTTSCNLMLLSQLSSNRRHKYGEGHPQRRPRDPMEQGWCWKQVAGRDHLWCHPSGSWQQSSTDWHLLSPMQPPCSPSEPWPPCWQPQGLLFRERLSLSMNQNTNPTDSQSQLLAGVLPQATWW